MAVRMMRAPTLDEVRRWPATVSIAQACEALGYSTSWGYDLANSGDFPCRLISVRSRKRVVTASLIEVLEGSATGAA
jgi:hypothetical protein